ncbi:DUF2262 domain-containing protein [Paenibacillus sp. CAU 1782]
METTIKSQTMGSFVYNKEFNAYEKNDGKVSFALNLKDKKTDAYELMARAEAIFAKYQIFEQLVKPQIARELIDYKNDFWPEYDEYDENLDWDEVNTGKYDLTEAVFETKITLLHIHIHPTHIYCEFNDGEMFGGHRIHSEFDYEYQLISADI